MFKTRRNNRLHPECAYRYVIISGALIVTSSIGNLCQHTSNSISSQIPSKCTGIDSKSKLSYGICSTFMRERHQTCSPMDRAYVREETLHEP